MYNSNPQKKKNKIESVAIIPVRGNSKRIPGKNIRIFAGKLLFCWTIDAAMKSPEVDFVILSTESQEIAAAANKYVTSEYPNDYTRFNVYIRPPELSQDHVQTDEVILFVLRQMHFQGLYPEAIVTLLATSPLRNEQDVTQAIKLYYRNEPATVISGSYVGGFYWKAERTSSQVFARKIPNMTGEVSSIGTSLEQNPAIRPGTQWVNKYDKLFKEDGAIYVTSAKNLETYRTKMIEPYLLYETGISVDIDTEEDWKNAERVFNNRRSQEQLGGGERSETETT